MSSNEDKVGFEESSLGSLLSELNLTRSTTSNGRLFDNSVIKRLNKIHKKNYDGKKVLNLNSNIEYKTFNQTSKIHLNDPTSKSISSISSNQTLNSEGKISYEINSSFFEPIDRSEEALSEEIESQKDAGNHNSLIAFHNTITVTKSNPLEERETLCLKQKIETDESKLVKSWLDEKRNISSPFFLKGRCTSSECGCVKTFDSAIEIGSARSSNPNSYSVISRDVSSQACESAKGLKLIDNQGEVEIQELCSHLFKSSISQRISDLSINSYNKVLNYKERRLLPSQCTTENLLRNYLQKSLYSDRSENFDEMSECSRDFPCSSDSQTQHKPQTINSAYGRFLHKIDKLKKLASWKSRKRKSKMKMAIDTPDGLQNCSEENANDKLRKNASVSVCTSRAINKMNDDSRFGDSHITNNDDIKPLKVICSSINEVRNGACKDVCDIGTQSVKSCIAAIGSVKNRTLAKESRSTFSADIYCNQNSFYEWNKVRSKERGNGDHSRFGRNKDYAILHSHGFSISSESVNEEESTNDVKIYWAITKVTKYPDNCKTYEIMKLSRKKPRYVPPTSETVFVLVPK